MEEIKEAQQISFLDDLFPGYKEDTAKSSASKKVKAPHVVKVSHIYSTESFSASKLPKEIKEQIIGMKSISDEFWQENPQTRWMWCHKCHMFYQSSDKNDVGCVGICYNCKQ
ncbi:MAG TPA: hypothetical protein DCS12_01245 [Clostridiales bacterium]|jgi:protein-arginine kinase activator protein McsA|nr:hypothetical protein [Clostridiales bacterium]